MTTLTRCAFVGRIAQLESTLDTELVEEVAHRLITNKDMLAGGRDVERIVRVNGEGGNIRDCCWQTMTVTGVFIAHQIRSRRGGSEHDLS